jgi:DNA mismatch endonuclease (patch repair protein)
MADIFSKKKRSDIMSKIRSSKTKPELKLKKLMKKFGFAYQPKNIFGKPDFAVKKNKIAIFIDGCFWHGCKKHHRMPNQNRKYWSEKIKRNIQRDKIVSSHLKKSDWKVLRIWEHEI